MGVGGTGFAGDDSNGISFIGEMGRSKMWKMLSTQYFEILLLFGWNKVIFLFMFKK